MNKFQKLAFADIDDFFEYIPKRELEIVMALRQLVLDCIPGCKEKLSYNVPFYYRYSRICFIWPAAIPWGNVKMRGVQLGFCKGYLLRDEINYLDKGNRKQVYSKVFTDLGEIEADLLRTYLFEAVFVDEQTKKNKS